MPILHMLNPLSFVRHDPRNTRQAGIQTLMKKYDDGMGCDEGRHGCLRQFAPAAAGVLEPGDVGVEAKQSPGRTSRPILLHLVLLLLVPLVSILWLARNRKNQTGPRSQAMNQLNKAGCMQSSKGECKAWFPQFRFG